MGYFKGEKCNCILFKKSLSLVLGVIDRVGRPDPRSRPKSGRDPDFSGVATRPLGRDPKFFVGRDPIRSRPSQS